MTQKPKIFEIGIIVTVLVILTLVWAINGYDDTWLYITAGLIVIPTSWFFFSKTNKD